MKHPASPALTRHADEALAVGARRIDRMKYQRLRCVADSEARAAESRRDFGFLFVAGRARSKTLVEETNLGQRARAERHIRAQHSAHLDYMLAVVDDRQIEIAGFNSRNLSGIDSGQDAALHRGELWMLGEKTLDRIEITRGDGKVVIEADDDFAASLRYRPVLRAAFAGPGFVHVDEWAKRIGNRRGLRRAVVGDQELMARRLDLRLEAREQSREVRRSCMGSDNDRKLQNCGFTLRCIADGIVCYRREVTQASAVVGPTA